MVKNSGRVVGSVDIATLEDSYRPLAQLRAVIDVIDVTNMNKIMYFILISK